MKKIFLLLVLAACTACNTEDDTQKPPQTAKFGGTLTVTSNNTPSAEPFELKNVVFEFARDEDGTFNMTMHEIRFASTMPMSLNIVIPKLKYADTDGDGISEFTSTVTPIVPYIGGKPYSAFEIPEFESTLTTGGKLSVTFTCKNDKIPVGGETLDHKAAYHGTMLYE